jgi:hypothetical protein
MAEVPVNEKLYAMVVGQAKAKYRIYPSPGASHWVHRRYLELGGKFEDSAEKNRREQMWENARRRLEEHRRGDDHDDKDDKRAERLKHLKDKKKDKDDK